MNENGNKISKALDRQVGGGHYKDCKIQPVEYIMANDLPYCEGNIVKYITRWKSKGGRQDIEKVIHYAQILLESLDNEVDVEYNTYIKEGKE